MPLLWSFRRCPYAMRARLAIKSSGIPVRLREIRLRDKPEEFIADSEKGAVPVLKFQDGKIIDESLEVVDWALSNNDPEDWLRVRRESPGFCHDFVKKLDGPFKDSLDRYKYATRYENGLEDEAIHRDLGAAFIREIDSRLQSQAYLSGADFGFLDAVSLPFIRQFRIANPNWFDLQSWGRVHGWLNEFLSSDRFGAIMTKFQPWKDEGEEFLF